MPLHVGKGRTESCAIADILDYAANPEKTDGGRLISSFGCDSRVADAEFLLAKRQYLSATGRSRGRDDVLAYQVRQSFKPGEITPEEANRLGVEFARRFTKGNHAFIVCTHIDKAHIHNHIIWSAVDLNCRRKYRNFWGSSRAVRRLSDTICVENGLSIVEDPKPHGKSYGQWLGDQAKLSHRELLRIALDEALAKHPADLEALWQLLRAAGVEVKYHGRAITLQAPGWQRPARLSSLGEEYSLEALTTVLSGQKTHMPRKHRTAAAPQKVNLLVDIQSKLQAGKGAGYAQWAKIFNLKQMAKTLNYLTEHGLLEYAALEEQTEVATVQYRQLSDQLKAIEKRMADLSAMRTQILHYIKTRDTYVAYRKAGYSKRFLAAHEGEITLHRAAKKFFDNQGLTKLPTIKQIQAEYAALQGEKKTIYPKFHEARTQMRELLTVKANVDRLLDPQERSTEPTQTAQR